MPGIRGYNVCISCGNRTSVTLYIQKRIDGKRKFVKFGMFCGNCAMGIQFEKEANRIVEQVRKVKYRLHPKIKGKGAPV